MKARGRRKWIALLLLLLSCAIILGFGARLLPVALQWIHPNVTYRVPSAPKTLFLTLDDGPSVATPQILDVLQKHGVHATFFVITDHIRPDAMRRMLTEGHEIGHHMKSTAKMDELSDELFQLEFDAAAESLAAYTHVRLFRPPDGSISRDRAETVVSRSYEIVVGTVYPLDHCLESKAMIVTLAMALATEGGILILHDTDSRGARTAAVLDELIPQLKKQGYRFALLPANSQRSSP